MVRKTIAVSAVPAGYLIQLTEAKELGASMGRKELS